VALQVVKERWGSLEELTKGLGGRQGGQVWFWLCFASRLEWCHQPNWTDAG
jgi:hypothetical protein